MKSFFFTKKILIDSFRHPTDHHSNNQSSSSSSQQLNAPNLVSTSNHPLVVKRKHSKSLCSGRDSRSSGSSADEGDDEDSEEEEAESDPGGETLVGSVITQLEELARHIRKVSMPPGVSPAPTPTGEENN